MAAPVPVNAAVVSVAAAVLMFNVALFVPVSCGVNCTSIVHLAGAGISAAPWQPSVVMPKLVGFVPVRLASASVGESTSPSLVTVNVVFAPVDCRGVEPANVELVGETLTV